VAYPYDEFKLLDSLMIADNELSDILLVSKQEIKQYMDDQIK